MKYERIFFVLININIVQIEVGLDLELTQRNLLINSFLLYHDLPYQLY